jgi:hypothetical protein
MHSKTLKGLSLGWSLAFFEYFENLLQISKEIILNKKNESTVNSD